MTKEEALKTYGDVPCRFSSYYKYDFAFRGIAADGAKVAIHIGGNSDDIYRLEVSANTVTSLRKEGGEWSLACVHKDGDLLWEDTP